MFWSMNETPRLVAFRRVVGGLNMGIGAILIVEQAGAIAFGLFTQPKLHFLLMGIALVISGTLMVVMKRNTRA